MCYTLEYKILAELLYSRVDGSKKSEKDKGKSKVGGVRLARAEGDRKRQKK